MVFAASGAVALAASPPVLETLRWTAPGAELQALSSQPATCLAYDLSDKPMVDAGQAMFNAPALLGGQAAKAGLSCASCHVNGRSNPHFMLAGVSDKPGTSDVTNSFFSAARGNGRFDPVLIPDLAAPGKIARESKAKALQAFIRTLIVEEFSGQEPSPAMLEALATYVRAVQSCDADHVPRKLEDQLSLIQAALDGAVAMAGRDDWQASRALISAARHQLGLVSERYAGPKLKKERALLLKASRELQDLPENLGNGKALADWKSRFDGRLAGQLRQKESQSLYNSMLLRTLVAPQR